MDKNPVKFLRGAGLIEAVSYLLLVGVAMPLKYIWKIPEPVKYVGWLHGLLFIIFCVALLRTWITARWPFGRVLLVFIAALIPIGPFLIDKRMKTYMAEFENNSRVP